MRLKKISIILLICIFASGCWDKTEIDRKSFVSAIAIDVGKDINKYKELEKVKSDEPFAERQFKKLNITYGFPNISQVTPGTSSTAEGQFINVDAASMEDGMSEATARSSRALYLGHTKVLLLSSEILSYPDIMKEIMDYLARSPSLNKLMQVVVVEGKAQKYAQFKPTMEKNIQSYISGIMESSSSNATILPITLTEMLVLLHQNGNAIAPRITLDKEKNELLVTGLAVMKNYGLKGFLTRVETADLELLRGKLKGGKRVIYKEGHPVDFVIDGMKRKIKVTNIKDKLIFDINLQLEGALKQYYEGADSLLVKQNIDELQQSFSKSISEECKEVAKITQKDFGVDSIGLQEYIEKFKPDIWNLVKKDWETVYKNAVINVNADVKIRRIGIVQ